MINQLKRMDLTAQYIGLRNNKKMKMGHQRIRNGKPIRNTQEIGKITKKMVSVFNFTEMEINMKEDGKLIKEMDKEHFGFQKAKIN